MLKIAGGIVLGFSVLIFLYVPIFPDTRTVSHMDESLLYHYLNCK